MTETKGQPAEKELAADTTTGRTRCARKMLWAITAVAAVSCARQSETPASRTAYIEVKGMVQQLGIT